MEVPPVARPPTPAFAALSNWQKLRDLVSLHGQLRRVIGGSLRHAEAVSLDDDLDMASNSLVKKFGGRLGPLGADHPDLPWDR
jgi:hypothetical protein